MSDLDERLARAEARCRAKIKETLENARDINACVDQLFGIAEEYAGTLSAVDDAKRVRKLRGRGDPDLD
jgi:hypothetical protein